MNLHSFLISAYNAEKFVEDTLDSIFLQMRYDKFEILIFNDGSTDDTHKIIKNWLQKKLEYKEYFKYYSEEKNKGKVSRFNFLFKKSIGNTISLLGADDTCTNYYPKIINRLISSKETTFSSCALLECDQNLNPIRLRMPYKRPDLVTLLNTTPGGTLIMKRSFSQLIFPIPENLENEDYWIQLKISQINNNFNLETNPLINYRRHQDSSTGGLNFKQKLIKRVKQRLDALSIFINQFNDLDTVRYIEAYSFNKEFLNLLDNKMNIFKLLIILFHGYFRRRFSRKDLNLGLKLILSSYRFD